jgi:hypothetical protein
MRTPLETATELDALLKRSKPFRNFQEVFNLLDQLITSLTPQEPTKNPVVETVVVETPTETVETTTVESKTTRKATKK